MLDQTVIQKIYDMVFKRIRRTEIDLFLCGGMSTPNRKLCRDSLRDEIRSMKNVAIYYPEDLFSEILARKKIDLFTLEKVLADNSDIIIIVCESPGSFTELGAFVNNSNTCRKVVAFIQSKYKNDKSFINQGPLEYLKTHSDRNTKVVYYNTDKESMKMKAEEVLKETANALGKTKADYKLSKISGQVCFILLLLYFFDIIQYNSLRMAVKERYLAESENDGSEAEKGSMQFDAIFSAAIKRMYRKRYLIKREDLGGYIISKEGYLKVNAYLKDIDYKPRMAEFCDKDVLNVKTQKTESNIEVTRIKIPVSEPDNSRIDRDRYFYVDGIRLDTLWKSFYRHG